MADFEIHARPHVADSAIAVKALTTLVCSEAALRLSQTGSLAKQHAAIPRTRAFGILRGEIWSCQTTKPNSVSDRNFSSLGRLTKKNGTCIFRPFPNGPPGLGDGVEWG